MTYLIAMGGFIGAIVIFSFITGKIDESRIRRHQGLSREGFVRFFLQQNIPEAVAGAMFDYYTGVYRHVKGITIHPTDHLNDFWSNDWEDLEDDGKHLMREIGLELDVMEEPHRWGQPIETIGDMVLWLDWARQRAILSREPNRNAPDTE